MNIESRMEDLKVSPENYALNTPCRSMGPSIFRTLNPLQVAVQSPPVVQAGIIESRLNVQSLNSLNIFRRQLKVRLNILLDLPVDRAFRDHRTTVANTPSKHNLDCAFVVLASKLLEDWLIDNTLHVRDLLAPAGGTIEVVHVAQRAELYNVDALGLQPLVEALLLEVGVYLHLVDRRDL